MPSITSALSLAFLASVALAAPTPDHTHEDVVTKSSFAVPRIRNENHVRNGTHALAKAYAKFGWSQSLRGSSSGSAGSGDFAWLFPDSASSEGRGSGGEGNSGSDSGSSAQSVTSALSGNDGSATTTTAQASTTVVTQSATTLENKASGTAAPAGSGAASAAAAGSVSGETTAVSQENGAEFLSPVSIGGKTFNLDFDTGSSDLWVYGASAAGTHTSLSTTGGSFKPLAGYSFMLSYGDGSSSSGTVGTDTVAVGSATVTSQAVEVATTVSSAFSTDVADGLMGLAFDSINSVSPKQQKTFFSNIQSQLAQPVFTVFLNESNTGEYEFGNIDSSKFTGNINYTPVNTENGFWQFTSTSYQINGKTASNANASPTIADTGTSLALLDDAVVEAYYAQVAGASYSSAEGAWLIPCTGTLPSFGVAIGSTGYFATIPGSAVNYAPASSRGGQSSMCFGGIQSNSGEGFQIIGDVMLRQHFVVFDGGETRIGFADKP